MKVKVRVTQVFRVEREILIDVDAEDEPAAVEQILNGETDTPAFGDPRWRTQWNLQNEEAEPATPFNPKVNT